jgi:hypothetical protein
MFMFNKPSFSTMKFFTGILDQTLPRRKQALETLK